MNAHWNPYFKPWEGPLKSINLWLKDHLCPTCHALGCSKILYPFRVRNGMVLVIPGPTKIGSVWNWGILPICMHTHTHIYTYIYIDIHTHTHNIICIYKYDHDRSGKIELCHVLPWKNEGFYPATVLDQPGPWQWSSRIAWEDRWSLGDTSRRRVVKTCKTLWYW